VSVSACVFHRHLIITIDIVLNTMLNTRGILDAETAPPAVEGASSPAPLLSAKF